jgi:GTP-binding protein HflX
MYYDIEEKTIRAALAGVYDGAAAKEEAGSLLAELAGLAKTLEMEVVAQDLVHTRGRTAQYGMGTGRAEALAEQARECGADCLVLDWDLAPAQQRNWEDKAGLPVIDRRELIIQIFAARAQTREASLQVELAGLRYSLPRLSRKRINLSRQRGGRYGTKGSGETKLETDRRLVQTRIHKLERALTELRGQRALQREQREKRGVPSCALVGYTNAGKSSLLNALTGAGAFVEDKLFATLDPTSRRLHTASGKTLICIDTVGFIRRLPHDLVEAFRSTLEEAAGASLLIHVLDASDPEAEKRYETVLRVLDELGAAEAPRIIALNKSDRVEPGRLAELEDRFPGALAVSAKTRAGLDSLLCAAEARL